MLLPSLCAGPLLAQICLRFYLQLHVSICPFLLPSFSLFVNMHMRANVRALFLNLPPAPQLATVSSVYWLRSSTLNRKSQQFCTTSTRPRLDHIDIFGFHGAGERQRRGLAPLPQPQSLGQHVLACVFAVLTLEQLTD